jgi:hypothetical protein
VLQVDRSGMCDAESDCAVFCVFKPYARILWFWGLNNNNLVKSLHFPQALTGLLPGSRAREQVRKELMSCAVAPKYDLELILI